MRRVTVEEMGLDPIGSFVAGETYLHFCAAPTLWGVILWGRPDEAHAVTLGQSLVKEMTPPAVPHASIIDVSRLESVDPGAFLAAGKYLDRYSEPLRHWLHRVALVRPGGIGGAVVAGAYEVLPRPYPVRVFAEPETAFSWLVAEGGAPDWPVDGPGLLAELFGEASNTPPMLRALRDLLDAHLVGLAVAVAASKLGVSERSLQRKLSEVGTTFQDELASARIRAAKRLLLDTDEPLTNIALDVGFSSLQHFSALFRKREGESPSAFRNRQRRT